MRFRSATLALSFGIAGSLVLGVATQTFAAIPNLVTNPSAVGGSTFGWGMSPPTANTGKVIGVVQNGVWWFNWTAKNVQNGSAWYYYGLGPTMNVSPGQQLSCGFRAYGQGTIVEDIFDGQADHFTAPVSLSSQPYTFSQTATVVTMGSWSYPPQVQVRFNNYTGNIDAYFTDVTCVVGTRVQLVADTKATSTTGGTSSPAASTSAASSSTPSPSGSAGTASLPQTGSGPAPVVGAVLALGAGLFLLRRPRHPRV